jgi:ABC-2 type transport system ATP-binding protein
MIKIRGLNFSYGQRKVLDNLHLDVGPSSIFAMLGPNGSGKSTLFRLLSTLLPVEEGRILINGIDPAKSASLIRSQIGVLFQHPALDGKLRVIENLRCGGHLYGMRGGSLEDAIQLWTRATGVDDRLRDFVETLSGGLRRRVEIAKALLPSPQLLILDEPSTGLDPGARAACREIYRQLQSRGLTILMTTHLMEEAADADQVAILHEGRIVAQGKPDVLCAELGELLLLIRSRTPAKLADWLKIQSPTSIVRQTGDEIRVFSTDVRLLEAAVHESFGDALLSTTLTRPGLEDVFAHHAGITMAEAEARTVSGAANKS